MESKALEQERDRLTSKESKEILKTEHDCSEHFQGEGGFITSCKRIEDNRPKGIAKKRIKLGHCSVCHKRMEKIYN